MGRKGCSLELQELDRNFDFVSRIVTVAMSATGANTTSPAHGGKQADCQELSQLERNAQRLLAGFSEKADLVGTAGLSPLSVHHT